MGPLEEEISTLMDRAIKGNPAVLEALTGGRPFDPNDLQAVIDLLGSMLVGQREAIVRIARAIDESR